ncbi:MAG: hypothetical protein EXR07_18510 [Acetobacteraceae bacterium]|nr:hypothetical protein [Acetobacteraceae bacterium]
MALRKLLRLAALTPIALTPIALAPAACGPEKNQFAPACPVPGLVKPLAELTRFRGASQDIRDLVVRARVIDITGKCKPGRTAASVTATVQIVADVTRGPALDGLTFTLPVFLAITDSGQIQDKNLYAIPVEFSRNVDTARAVSAEIELELPVSAGKTAAAYGIIAGFQLTPDEIAAFRRNRR